MNISTAMDMIMLSIHATQNPILKRIVNTEVHRCYNYNSDRTRKEAKEWRNTNLLLKEGWQGVKTGQTNAAGSCLSSCKDNIYIVVLNCPDGAKRFS